MYGDHISFLAASIRSFWFMQFFFYLFLDPKMLYYFRNIVPFHITVKAWIVRKNLSMVGKCYIKNYGKPCQKS